MVKKHIRKNQDQPQGEIAEREGTIHWSNVRREALYFSEKRKPKDAVANEVAEDKSETEE
jgi:large subunit ribosomal protein L24